jgi:acetoin utilization protein AcuB
MPTAQEATVAGLTVRALMTTNVITVRRDTLLADMLALMREGQFRHLPVIDDDDEVIGILSDRDLARLLGSTPLGWTPFEPGDTTAARAMTSPVETVEPDDDAREAAQIMFEAKIGCLPVVEGRHLVGILTEADFVRYVASGED